MSAAMGFFLGTQERVRSSFGKRAIGVQAIEIQLDSLCKYRHSSFRNGFILKSYIPLKYNVKPLVGEGFVHDGSYRESTPYVEPLELLKHIPWPMLRTLQQAQLSSSRRTEATPFCTRYIKESMRRVITVPAKSIEICRKYTQIKETKNI